MAYKRYRSLFSEKRLSGSSKFRVQEKIRRILQEKALSTKDIDSIVGKIEAVITDVISGYGVDNAIVDELSNTVKNINSYGSAIAVQNDSISQAVDMEETFKRKQRRLRENMFGMDASDDLYNDDQMYVTDIDDYGNEIVGDDSIEDGLGYEMDDMGSGFYEGRRNKINRLSRKLREGEESEDFITDSEDLTDEEAEYDEEEEGEQESESVEIDEEDEVEESEDSDSDDIKVETDQMDEEDEEDSEEEEAKKEHFRRNRLRRESRSFRKPMRRNAYNEESESEEGEDIIPMGSGSDYDFLDGIDEMGNASSDRSMTAKYDFKKGM